MATSTLKGVIRTVEEYTPTLNDALRPLVNKFLTPTGEPQRGYAWEVEIMRDVKGKEGKRAKFYAKTISIPQSVVDTIQIDYMGSKVFYAGKDASAHTVTITLWDDQSLQIYAYLQNWYNKINDKVARQVSKENYTRDIKLTLLDTTDLFTTAVITLKDAFLTEIGDVTLNYESSDVIEISATFTFDKKSVASEYNE